MKYNEGQTINYQTKDMSKGTGKITYADYAGSSHPEPVFCHNNPSLDDGYRPQNMYGYQYALRIPKDPVKMGYFIYFKPAGFVEVLQKSTPQGKIFRRIYKEDGDMMFVGGVCKDIEECANPSQIISVMDSEFLKRTDWSKLETTQTAEEKLRMQRPKRF